MKQQRHGESPSSAFLPNIDPASATSLVRQLYLSLREAIVEGRLCAGHRLPATRLASKEWGLSRGSIAEAYEILTMEGYVISRRGSGTYVASGLPDAFSRLGRQRSNPILPRGNISAATANVIASKMNLEPPAHVPFTTGRITHDERTARLLGNISRRHLDYLTDGYGDIQGEPELRSAIVSHLMASRGVRCTADQVFITSGTQQALDLAFRTLVTPGDTVLVEDPCYPPARQSLLFSGAKVIGLPVDQDGLVTENLPDAQAGAPTLIYITPSHQYPAGSALSLARRLELLAYARDRACWIVEDDYDSEFRYEGHPIASLQGLDQNETVIYAGTFSKSLLPSLRIGYLVVPTDLISAIRAVRPILDRYQPIFQQRLVADFLNEGYFPAHLRRLRERYRTSRNVLANLLDERLREHLSFSIPEQGIHLTARSTGTWKSDVVVAMAARRKGIVVIPTSPMYVSEPGENGIILGFSGLSEQEADMGTQLLAKIFRGADFR